MAVVDFFRRIEVNLLCDFCFEFNSLSSSEKNVENRPRFDKVIAKVRQYPFLRHSVSIKSILKMCLDSWALQFMTLCVTNWRLCRDFKVFGCLISMQDD